MKSPEQLPGSLAQAAAAPAPGAGFVVILETQQQGVQQASSGAKLTTATPARGRDAPMGRRLQRAGRRMGRP
jgi:hypothetical protein